MASKKPIIVGVGRPQGFIDDAAKAIGKIIGKAAKRKPKTISEMKSYPTPSRVRTGGPPRSDMFRKQVNSNTSYTMTYDKGSSDYKRVLKAQSRDAQIMKKVNKPNPAVKKRSIEYNEARAAEKRIDVTNPKSMLAKPDQYSKDAAAVRKFKNNKLKKR